MYKYSCFHTPRTLITKKYAYLFSYNRNCNVDWLNPDCLQTFKQIKAQSQKNSSFLKQNSADFIKYLLDMMDSKQYRTVLKVLNQIDYGKVGQWKSLFTIGNGIRQMLKVNKLQKQPVENKRAIFEIMKKFHYQPNKSKDSNLFKFIDQQIKQSGQISEEQKIRSLVLYSSHFLALNPQLFSQYKQTLQHFLLSQSRQFSSINRMVFIEGLICGFWDQQFINKVKQYSNNSPALTKYINFCDTSIKNQITYPQNNIQYKKTATQAKIGEILKDLGYRIHENAKINQIQVDYLLPNNFVLEFNGVFHYNIAHQQPKPRIYQLWKNNVFRNRNFYRCIIPFYQWEKLMNQKSQRGYLMRKIEFAEIQRQLGPSKTKQLLQLYKKIRLTVQ